MFKVDGIEFSGMLVSELRRNVSIQEGENSGYVLDGTHRRDITGSYLSYSIVVDPSMGALREYDKLFEIITSPAESHIVEFPYGQTVYTFEAEIAETEDVLIVSDDGYNLWNDLTITFNARKPKRRAVQ